MTLGKSLIAVLLTGAVGMTPAQEPSPPAAQAGTAKAGGVTLITGDRVVAAGRGHRVEPGPGRQVSFTSQVRGGHLYVIPSDAHPLIAQGVLDRRLFDVTQLLAWGYGDADTPDIPVISQGAGVPQGMRQSRSLAALGMAALRVPKANAAQAWKELTGKGARALAAGRGKLWLDGHRSFSLDQSVKQIGAPEAWQQGMTGKDVTVAVLDSGYDPDHPDLKDAVVQARDFSDESDVRDRNGHGTHVASIVAGRGGKYRGVAPEAKLAIGKVGSFALTDSAILAGMEWAAVEVKAKIINMSLGGPDSLELDPVEQAVNTLSERTGALFVVAAGNGGTEGRVSSPGSADAALTVGAVDKQGTMGDFSSPGPRVGDHAIKPDVTAPGVGIMAAAPTGAAHGPYVSRSGTSMASPHVAGAAAILAQRHPEWTGAQLKSALIGSAKPSSAATSYQQGAGLVDLVRALKQQVAPTQANLWAAFPWNGTGERVTTRTITYANSGDTPVGLDLAVDGEVLKLSADRVEVPAKGEASVTLTIDAGGKAPGDYPGTVTARSGETVIRTLAGAYVEPESYDLTVAAIGRQGEPVVPMQGEVYDAKTGAVHELVFLDGKAKIRLPEGDWNLFTDITEGGGGRALVTTVTDTPVKIDGADRQLTVDARQGRPVRITVDDPSAALQKDFSLALRHGTWNTWVSGWSGQEANTHLFVTPVHQPGLSYSLETTWLSKDVSPSPFVYHLVDRRTDGIPDDPAHAFEQKDLAKVTMTYRASGVAGTGTPYSALQDSDFPGASLMPMGDDITLPGTLIHYRTPGLIYESGLQVGTSMLADGGRFMRRGHTSQVWNAAVTGPSFLLPGGSRIGDKLSFSAVGLFADSGAGKTGSDTAATGTAILTRDGQVVAKADLANCGIYERQGCELHADLPAESAAYTLTASMRRQVPYSALSTGVESVWTFASSNTAEERPLPLMAMRYAPTGLDDSNRAKPGSLTPLPMWIERNPGSAKAEVKSVRLEMSSDDGTTWRRIPVVRTGKGWTAVVPNPRTPGFVSLRAVVTDAAGAGLTQTITRAYGVG